MAYNVSWLNQDRIILIAFSGIISIEEVEAAFQENVRLQQTGIAPMYAVIDTSAVKKMKFSLNKLLSALPPRNPDVHWRVVVTSDTQIRLFASIAIQTLDNRFRIFSTLEDALGFLEPRLMLNTTESEY